MGDWRSQPACSPAVVRPGRRRLLAGAVRLASLMMPAAASLAVAAPAPAAADSAQAVTLSVPGPGDSVAMPAELAVRLGLDRARGIALRLRFVGGGGVAISELNSRNADYAIFGLPAMMQSDLRGAQLRALAAIDDLPLYSLMVRSDLRTTIRRVADLRGRVVGVHSYALGSKTTSQQVLELLLRTSHVPLESVHMVPAGQSWETQSAALRSRSVDASLCDEPFGLRMVREGIAVPLFSTGRPEDLRRLPGGGFLRAVLVARQDAIAQDPDLAGRMVDTLRASLQWIAAHPAETLADQLELARGPEREAFIEVFQRFPRQYSRDGRFSQRQLRETENFFRDAEADNPGAQNLSLDNLIDDRWAGRKA